MIKTAIIALIAIVAPNLGYAEGADYFSATKLRGYCTEHDPGFVFGCQKYIHGFVEGIRAGSEGRPDAIWCFPNEANVGQAVLIVEKFMRDNPALLHQEAGLIVGLALLQA